MAVKEKNAPKTNKLVEILKTEQKWENWVLLVLAIIALTLSCLILGEVLVPAESFPIIGSYPKVFAWVLIVVSVFGIGLVIWPFLKLSVPELKKITWANGKDYGVNLLRVFIFIIFIALLFFGGSVLFELFIEAVL